MGKRLHVVSRVISHCTRCDFAFYKRRETEPGADYWCRNVPDAPRKICDYLDVGEGIPDWCKLPRVEVDEPVELSPEPVEPVEEVPVPAPEPEPVTPLAERLAVSIKDAAVLLSVSHSTVRRMVEAGTIRVVKIGDTRVPMSEIRRLIGGEESA